jgi:hypothetical protein
LIMRQEDIMAKIHMWENNTSFLNC